jgi:HEAT repeat protein
VLMLIDVESSVRAAAASSLRKVDRHWEKSEEVRRALPEIKAGLQHPDYWVRHCATTLLEQLKVARKSQERESPAIAFAQEREAPATHAAFPILADLLVDHDRNLRLAAAEVLGRLHEKSAATLLAAAVRDADHQVRQAARLALTALN